MASPVPGITDAQFTALSHGYGDRDAVLALRDGQLGLRKLLLKAVTRSARERLPGTTLLAEVNEAWDRLTAASRSTPDCLDGTDGLLRHPYVAAWAVRCLNDLADGQCDDAMLATRLGHLTAIGAAAAHRAGQETAIDVTVADGGVTLPTLGRIAIEVPNGTRVTVKIGEEITVRAGTRAVATSWQPVRYLRQAPEPVRLEDIDPYRDAHQWPVSDRLSIDDAARWQQTFDEAWRIIASDHPAYLPGLAAGLATLTPLANPDDGRDVSAASRYAFGAIGTVLPASPAILALLLIHEFQHVKLHAVLDLVPLHDGCDDRLYYAPWRPDPRPLGALLHGVYAHLGVTDFWRVHRHSTHADAQAAMAAATQFALWRVQTAEAVDTLSRSPALTEAGQRFATGMAETIAPWLTESVPHEALLAARRRASEHRAAHTVAPA